MSEKHNIYEIGLDKHSANFEQLSPTSFLFRSAQVFPDRVATINGSIRRTWAETADRCCKMAAALIQRGVRTGDTVSVIAPNISEVFELHFAIPLTGAVLNTINTRLDAESIAFILQHAESSVVFVDKEFTSVVQRALAICQTRPLVIAIDDPHFHSGSLISELTYEHLISEGREDTPLPELKDEWQAIALNYTSGTIGNPKGVVYHHRGAYLNAVSNILSWDMGKHPVYLWTLPMFHCNGWCFPWTIATNAGINVSLRHVREEPVLAAIREFGVTHFCAAPIVLNMINNAPDTMKQGIDHKVCAMTAGAAPPAAVIEGMEAMGFEVTHVYGLTETYGPCVVCEPQQHWKDLDNRARAKAKSRQGIRAPMQGALMVANPVTMEPVPRDGETMGEIMLRGNIVMKGYLKNPSTTDESFDQGWYHTGDLAVWHPDSYVEIKDRFKDIIISGGENISSIEVEDILYRHPDIEEVAVVAIPDEKWGEVPCAFVKTKAASILTERDVIEFSRQHMAHFKTPKKVIFTAIPKTSTGKVQKYLLREQIKGETQ